MALIGTRGPCRVYGHGTAAVKAVDGIELDIARLGPLTAGFAAGELLLILAVAVTAATLPARRTARIPVADALRHE